MANLKNILELKMIRVDKERLAESEAELIKPALTDLSLIPMLYNWFVEISGKTETMTHEKVLQRKKFLFILLCLYSPRYFAGYRMCDGLRDAMFKVMDYKSPSCISDMCRDITDMCDYYKSVRRGISHIYDMMLERLRDGRYIAD